jgi:hypothetical protein
MRKRKNDRRTQTSFLLSLILHVVMALVLAFILIEQSQEEASESLEVHMISATKRVLPPRRSHLREPWQAVPDSRNPRKEKMEANFELQRFEQADVDAANQPRSSNTMSVIPELATSAERLRSRFDMSLPRASGADVVKPSTGSSRGTGSGPGAGSVGLSAEAGLFETALYWIARNTANRNTTGNEDVVFLIDASGTMKDNIMAVARYISKMIDVFKESDLDYTMGVIRFNRDTLTKTNDVKIYEQTSDADKIRKTLRSIKCIGDERTLDAIEIGLTQVEFRDPSDRTFILVTDEAFTPRTATRQTRRDLTHAEMLEIDFREVLKACQDSNIKIDVLGIDDEMHKLMAKETGGLWFQVPQQEDSP